jgi:SAM-dependent methyltransferase
MSQPDLAQIRAYYRAVLPFYDASLEDRGDLPFWQAMARRWGGRRILELGCGTGRITPLLAAVAPTVATDLLIEMLREAERRAPSARFVVADLRQFAFVTKFDLVAIADDPMAHVTRTDDRMQVLQRIASHLTPAGRLVLEGLHRPPEAPSLIPARDVSRSDQKPFTIIERWEPAGDGLWNATYRFEQESGITEATSLLRSWTMEEVGLLPEAGLEVEELWGDFDQRPFTEHSPRIVIVARRTWMG